MTVDKKLMDQCIYCHNFCKFACQPSLASHDQKVTENQKNYFLDLYINKKIPMDREFGLSAFRCNDCKRCEYYCIYEPKGVLQNNRAARKMALDAGYAPAAVYEIEKNLRHYRDIYKASAGRARGPDFSKDSAEVLVYLGDYTRMLEPAIFGSFKKILEAMGIDYSYDKNEISSGMVALDLGMEDVARGLMQENASRLSAYDCQKIVFLDADACWGFRQEYGDLGFKIDRQVMHYTELLAQNIDRLRIGGTGDRVKYFDPCKLGRYLKVFDQPREVLSRMASNTDFDFFKNREESKCCGGHIVLFDRELSANIADETLEEFMESGAGYLITSCPLCLHNFKQSRLSKDIVICDLVEYLALKIET